MSLGNINLEGIVGESESTTTVESVVASETPESSTETVVSVLGADPTSTEGSQESVQEETQSRVTIVDIVNNYSHLISNCNIIDLDDQGIPQSEGILFLLDNGLEDDGTPKSKTPFFLQNTGKLFMNEFVPTRVQVFNSGVVVSNAENRVYIIKTHALQYSIGSNGTPTLLTKLKKTTEGSPLVTTTSPNAVVVDLDRIKFNVRKVSQTLYKMIRNMDEVESIRDATVLYMETVGTLHHLIRIETEIFMDSGLQ